MSPTTSDMSSVLIVPQLVVELADVRIIALGVLNKPRGSTTVNTNARTFLHPPGIEKVDDTDGSSVHRGEPIASATSGNDSHKTPRLLFGSCELFLGGGGYCAQVVVKGDITQMYRQMSYPLPALSHANYPFYTPSGEDKRWIGTDDLEEEGMQWVGGLM